MNIIDLFAGAGGFSEGFKKVGFNVLAAVEKDEQIAKTYKSNHLTTKVIIEDMTNRAKVVDKLKEEIGNKTVDIVIGGPPCQGFSMAGARIREESFLEDERNYLFRDYFNILTEISPDYFVMENVQGLLSSNDGKIIDEIIRLFSREGYKVDKTVLNAADFGVPQSRRRLFIIGSKYEKINLAEETTKECAKKEEVALKEAISDLNYLEAGEGKKELGYKNDYLNEIVDENLSDYQRERRKNSKKLYNHKATRHSKSTIEKIKLINPGENWEKLTDKYNINSKHSGAYGRLEWDKLAITITTRFDTPSGGRFIHPERDRTLTAREAARIQSFDDNYRFLGTKSSVRTQIGNAVPPLMAKVIAEIIKKDIKKRR
ncbi:DNA cytosine methyltransferase [Natroniella acetigena]|uniref:DNA cytosine methyltransferase n=1 Tax=Natroniella acetigena TaxID=52004 RepID=UPI00200ACA76|nr:DNA cytosine methyltransferase [Natroniella acetigena]MCK8826339.1 DNA cytosine methyltransferase [Natroniella acetigena]